MYVHVHVDEHVLYRILSLDGLLPLFLPPSLQLLCNVASWFTFYCITRTLSNSIEACLTPVILYYWTLACQSKNTNSVVRYEIRYCYIIYCS
jgi:hypothetical protein